MKETELATLKVLYPYPYTLRLNKPNQQDIKKIVENISR